MSAVLKIVEKSLGRPQEATFELRLVSERMTGREIIARHIAQEVTRQNEKRSAAWTGHRRAGSFMVGFEPHPAEQKLNLAKPVRRPKLLDPAAEHKAALAAFESNRMIMLLDDRQIEDLDAEITLRDNSEVTFLRLVPLVGG